MIGGDEVERLRTVQIADMLKHHLYIFSGLRYTLNDVLHIFVNACSDHQGFCFCHESLLLREFVQPLKCAIQTIYCENSLEKLLCVNDQGQQVQEYIKEEKAY